MAFHTILFQAAENLRSLKPSMTSGVSLKCLRSVTQVWVSQTWSERMVSTLRFSTGIAAQ